MPSITDLKWFPAGQTPAKPPGDPPQRQAPATSTPGLRSAGGREYPTPGNSQSDGSGQQMVRIRRRRKKRTAPSPPTQTDTTDSNPSVSCKRKLSNSFTNKQIWRMYRKTKGKGPPPPIPTPDTSQLKYHDQLRNENNNIDYGTDRPNWDNLIGKSTPSELFETNWRALGSAMKGDDHYNTLEPVFEDTVKTKTLDESVYWSESPSTARKLLTEISPTTTCVSGLKRVEQPLLSSHKKGPAPLPPVSSIALGQPPPAATKPNSPLRTVITSPATVIPRQSPGSSSLPAPVEVPPPPPRNPPPLKVMLDSPPPSPTADVEKTRMELVCQTPQQVQHTPTDLQHTTMDLQLALLTPPGSSASSPTSGPTPPPPPPVNLNTRLMVPSLKDEILAASSKLRNIQSEDNVPSIKAIPATPTPSSRKTADSTETIHSPLNGDVKSELLMAVQARARRLDTLRDGLPLMGHTQTSNIQIPLAADAVPPANASNSVTNKADTITPHYPSPLTKSLKEELLQAASTRLAVTNVYPSPLTKSLKEELLQAASTRSAVTNVYPSPLTKSLKEELLQAASTRSAVNNVYPSPLTQSLKDELLQAATGRVSIPAVYPAPLAPCLKQELLKTVAAKTEHKPTTHLPHRITTLAADIRLAFEEREARRKKGAYSLRPFKVSAGSTRRKTSTLDRTYRNSDSSGHSRGSTTRRNSSDVLLQNISKLEQKQSDDRTTNHNSWVPEYDLPTDAFDDKTRAHTARAGEFYHQTWGDTSPQQQTAEKLKSKAGNSAQKHKDGKIKRIQRSMKNVFGSLRKTFRNRDSLKELRKEGWEMYSGGQFDGLPDSPVKISHVEHSPAYAFHSGKGELYLIPNFDKVLVTKDGTRIREREIVDQKDHISPQLSDNPIKLGHVLPSDDKGDDVTYIDEERQTLEQAETPFLVIQQMNVSFKADEANDGESPVSPVWKLVTSPLAADKPYATIGSTASGWSNSAASSPRKTRLRSRSTSVRLLQSDDSDAGESMPRYSRNNSFRILWRGTNGTPHGSSGILRESSGILHGSNTASHGITGAPHSGLVKPMKDTQIAQTGGRQDSTNPGLAENEPELNRAGHVAPEPRLFTNVRYRVTLL